MNPQTVPILSIVCMAITGLLSVGLPVGLWIWFHKKYNAKLFPALIGASAFVLFVFILERLVHGIVLRPDANGQVALLQKPFLYVLYGALMAGLFEETARLVSFHLLKKHYGGLGNALAYGVGHGGVEAILIVALAMVSNITFSLMINSGTTSALGDVPNLEQQIATMVNSPSWMFLVGGIERIGAITVHIALSVVVYYAVAAKAIWLYPFAIALHALVDVPAAMSQIGIITNIWVVEALVLACAVLLVFVARWVHLRYREAQSVQSAA